MPRRKRDPNRASKWPNGLDQEAKTLLAIGHLVAATSCCEYFFFAVLDCLVGQEGKRHTEIIWLSHRSIRNRINMVLRIAKINNLEPKLLKEIERAKSMNGISRLRNYYCHARYTNEPGDAQFEGYEIGSDYDSEDKEIVRTTIKPIKRRSINELAAAITRATELFGTMTRVAHRVRTHTATMHVTLPRLPDPSHKGLR